MSRDESLTLSVFTKRTHRDCNIHFRIYLTPIVAQVLALTMTPLLISIRESDVYLKGNSVFMQVEIA